MDWDSIVETKIKNKEFIGGESLAELKAFINSLPDVLPEKCTASIRLELRVNK